MVKGPSPWRNFVSKCYASNKWSLKIYEEKTGRPEKSNRQLQNHIKDFESELSAIDKTTRQNTCKSEQYNWTIWDNWHMYIYIYIYMYVCKNICREREQVHLRTAENTFFWLSCNIQQDKSNPGKQH
jgi:hypothetical protein